MMEELPVYIQLLFGLTVILTIGWFYLVSGSKTFLFLAITWTVFQSIFGLLEIYLYTMSIPPRIILYGIFPAIVGILVLFLTRRGRIFIDNLDLKMLTYFHTVRIPVEIVLVLLFHHGLVSIYMTFEGTNFDLIAGMTAAPVAYFAFLRSINKKLLIGWNIFSLLLLLNVVITAVFAFPSPFQKIAFDQPNIAILYFPFNLLPTVIVPLVLLGHLAAIRQLLNK